MKIKDVFEAMHSAGLTNSQIEFSSVWLGRSPRYYSHLIAVGREPGLATLCGIKWRLEQLQAKSSSVPNLALLEFQQQLTNKIDRRAIIDIRRHRS